MIALGDVAALLLRVIIFAVMFFHGTQKLFGWWGGRGLDGAEAFFTSLGFRPPRLVALVASTTETIASVLLLLGLVTPLAVAMLIGVFTNIAAIHVRNGLESKKHGFELELVMFGSVAAVGLLGPGLVSLDSLLGLSALFSAPGLWWVGPVAIGLGLVGGVGISLTRSGERSGPGLPASAQQR
ncbi:MAG TPA: DoxX family protein [Galbitalea sp.]|jgi:putative oxidoreductase|nr:DoxX family protein [Galbitalea sp.]